MIHQEATPFRYSGQLSFQQQPMRSIPHYAEFVEATGIELEANCGIDTSHYSDEWQGVKDVKTEIVLADFCEARARRQINHTGDLFAASTAM